MIDLLSDLLKLAICISAWGIAAFFFAAAGNGLRGTLLAFFVAQAALWTLVVVQRIPTVQAVLVAMQPWLGVFLLLWQALAFAVLVWALYVRRVRP